MGRQGAVAQLLALGALSVLLFLTVAECRGGELTVQIQTAKAAGKVACGETTLELSPLSTGSSPPASVEAPAQPDKAVRLEVPDGPWQVHLRSAGCWAPEQKVLVAPGKAQQVTLPVWAVAEVAGRLLIPLGSTLPETVRLTFSSSFANPTAQEPNGFVLCPVGKENAFRCRLPAAKLDLRLSTEGFAPEYWWAAEPRAGKPLELGSVRLAPGASLAGWLLTEDGEPPRPEDIEISLVPGGLADAETLGDQLLRRFARKEARPAPNGFFQLGSLKAGDYLLAVTGKGYAETRLRVSLVEGRESNLRDPVFLASPLRVSFSVTPPSAPGGEPWLLFLARLHETGTYADTVLEAEIPLDGWYEAKGLNPGLHLVKVLGPRGDSVFARRLRLGEEPSPIQVEIGAVRVEGRVTLGDEAVAGATIWYGGRWGVEKVRVESDEEGNYQASLPRAGEWPVDVEAKEPAVVRRWPVVEVPEPEGGEAVEIDLEMPATRIFGTVRDASGRPPSQRTIVYVYSGTSSSAASGPADEQGSFDYQGLDEGVFYVHAAGLGGQTRAQKVSLNEDAEQELHLVLEPTVEVRGRVVGESGPIPGADVQLQPAHLPFMPLRRAKADGAGEFSQQLPPGTTAVFATVSLPGRTLGVYQAPVEEGREITLHLPADGGTLKLQYPDGIEGPGSTWHLLFFRNGLPFGVYEVLHWSSLHPEVEQPEGGRIIPSLVEGHYEACWIPEDAYIPWLMGARDLRRCASGTLSALGELTLKLPKVDRDNRP